MAAFRTKATQDAYDARIAAGALATGCVLCNKESTHDFTHWRIIANDFPYDGIAEKHDMLLPRRHVTENGLSEEELAELARIKTEYVSSRYDWIMESAGAKKSVPGHFHLHLIIALP